MSVEQYKLDDLFCYVIVEADLCYKLFFKNFDKLILKNIGKKDALTFENIFKELRIHQYFNFFKSQQYLYICQLRLPYHDKIDEIVALCKIQGI